MPLLIGNFHLSLKLRPLKWRIFPKEIRNEMLNLKECCRQKLFGFLYSTVWADGDQSIETLHSFLWYIHSGRIFLVFCPFLSNLFQFYILKYDWFPLCLIWFTYVISFIEKKTILIFTLTYFFINSAILSACSIPKNKLLLSLIVWMRTKLMNVVFFKLKIPESRAPCINDQYWGCTCSPASSSLGTVGEGRGVDSSL